MSTPTIALAAFTLGLVAGLAVWTLDKPERVYVPVMRPVDPIANNGRLSA